jgi:NAD+ synthase (glutamine-hydrolysing)
MANKLRVVIAQLNLLVGDIEGNFKKHLEAAQKAKDIFHADIIVFPELSLTGYPPEDLLLRQDFLTSAQQALIRFMEEAPEIYCIVGHPHFTQQGLLNAASVIYNGKILGTYGKQHLPNYDVFDEYRYFVSGNSSHVLPIKGVPIGLIICEDLWRPEPIQQAMKDGARLIIVPNASPYEQQKYEHRAAILSKQAKTHHIPIIYANQIGGQDELIFDGCSMVVDAEGQVKQLAGFTTEVLHPVNIEINTHETKIDTIPFHIRYQHEKVYNTLAMGVRDYIHKNRFPGAIIGVSGGIDSALTLAIAADALGAENVQAVFMPSRFTADISREDAYAVANALHVPMETIAIEEVYQSFLDVLAPIFKDLKPDVTEENIQSRARAVILMALSNKTGRIVLTTGNRSEMAVGYTTLYGDMSGGFAVLKDVFKTDVYKLAYYRNSLSPVIPQRTLERAPTAELRFEQKDEDTLPPYSLLDKILSLYLNDGKSIDEIANLGIDKATVVKIVRMVIRNEYKRQQAPVGVRLQYKSFGKDWRYPITSGWKY